MQAEELGWGPYKVLPHLVMLFCSGFFENVSELVHPYVDSALSFSLLSRLFYIYWSRCRNNGTRVCFLE
jgi:hypothetical protein